MNRIVAVLLIILVASNVTCGFLFYHNNELLNRNDDLLNQNNELHNQVDGLSEQNSGLNNQNNALNNQTNDLQEQNNELLTQKAALQNQLNTLQSQLDDYENQTTQLQTRIDELEQHNLELQNQIDQLNQLIIINSSSLMAKITNFTITGFAPLVGIWIWSDAHITVQNLGTNDLQGLTLELVHPEGYPEGAPSPSGKIENLTAGEEKTIIVEGVSYVLGPGPHFVVTLKLGDVILDEYCA
jgi:cell division protein FtsB